MRAGFERVEFQSGHTLEDYRAVLGNDCINKLEQSAIALRGLKIVEINSTRKGGGVAQLLAGQIPLCQSLNLSVDWYTLPADAHFFEITKEIHNRLQGQGSAETELDLDYYNDYLASLVAVIPEADLYILHDPQTLGLAPHLKGKPLIWRCHIDLTEADSTSFTWLSSYYSYFRKVVFSLESYARGLEAEKVAIIQPAIDPLSPKNKELSKEEVSGVIGALGLSEAVPFMLQVSRFDKFKDPMGVVDIYQAMQRRMPELNCVLAGDYADDDPEGERYYKAVQEYATKATGGKVYFVVGQTGVEINALQRAATVVIQNSTREGFGLTVTEALWKNKLVFSRPVGGISKQILDGQTGYFLPAQDEDSASLILDAMARPDVIRRIGETAHAYVREHYVLPVMLATYLETYQTALRNPSHLDAS
ncbi:glycosyltransferase [Candidatus Saccharibacteria bacterium]|nr:glycosyltransferase [Candidatus Saccharibacteria bacterium]